MAAKTPWPVCDSCQSIPPSAFTVTRGDFSSIVHQLWPSFKAFAESACKGCHVCTLLYEAVREPFRSRLETAAVYLEFISGGDGIGQSLYITVDLGAVGGQASREEAQLQATGWTAALTRYTPVAKVNFVRDVSEVPANAKHYQGLISSYADDDGALRYIKQNLNDCLAQHMYKCDRVIFPSPFLEPRQDGVVNIVHGDRGSVVAPTRLVYVGSDRPNDPPKLVAGQECLYKGGHLVLSYCWGSIPKSAPWLLTQASEKDFAAEIPMHVLPQTLHDAILWTRQLGERYIWIDSMCIIQDSKDDWQREASRMGSIYGSATMTLVAASGSIYGGMTDRRNPLRNCAAALTLSAEGSCAVYILPNGQKPDRPPPPPTESRGWCSQEDVLSSRLVKITRGSILWQCVGEKSNGAERARGREQLLEHAPERWYTIWYRFIEIYSNKKFTYSSDKLLAFYGIACDKVGRDYVAGMLKSDPWASLLWCRDENQIRLRLGERFAEYVAPSWSWAAIDVPVIFYEAGGRSLRPSKLEETQYNPELHSAEAKAASYFETGAVVGGHVELSVHSLIAYTGPTDPFLFNTRQGAHTYGRRNLRDLLTGKPLGMIVFDVATEAHNGMIVCCVLLHVVNIELWLKNGTAGLGLALKRSGNSSGPTTYKRVGYVQFTPAAAALFRRRRVRVV